MFALLLCALHTPSNVLLLLVYVKTGISTLDINPTACRNAKRLLLCNENVTYSASNPNVY